MILSMTGYGSAALSFELGDISAEVRSVNNRFLEVSVRLPREMTSLEGRIRDEVRKRLRRGKVDVSIRTAPGANAPAPFMIQASILARYAQDVRAALDTAPGGDRVVISAGDLLNLPGVMAPTAAWSDNGTLASAILDVATRALDDLVEVRRGEGRALSAALEADLTALDTARQQAALLAANLPAETKRRMLERLEALLADSSMRLEPGRLEQEAAFLADKMDVSEEVVRLEAHIEAFRGHLRQPRLADGTGKTLDFLVQEALREVTTLGNKARSAELSSLVISMKATVERLREQVQNVE